MTKHAKISPWTKGKFEGWAKRHFFLSYFNVRLAILVSCRGVSKGLITPHCGSIQRERERQEAHRFFTMDDPEVEESIFAFGRFSLCVASRLFVCGVESGRVRRKRPRCVWGGWGGGREHRVACLTRFLFESTGKKIKRQRKWAGKGSWVSCVGALGEGGRLLECGTVRED